MKYYLRNVNDGTITEWTMDDILDMLNSARSPQWIPYDKMDFQEGLTHFTEYRIATKLERNIAANKKAKNYKFTESDVPF